MIDENINGTQADGIMGMAPATNGEDKAVLFVKRLAEEKIIPRHAFGVNFNTLEKDSKMTLGGYDNKIVANDTLFNWVGLMDSLYWSLPHKSTTYGGVDLGLSAKRGILDTGTSLTYFSPSDWEKVWAKISAGRK